MTTISMSIDQLAGVDLGKHTAHYDADDAILYALAVGAPHDDLSLVYERDMRVLPTYACALGLWAVEAAGELGAYDRKYSLHASQQLVMHKAMPTSGSITMTGKIANVYDKGKATLVQIEVSSDYFTAVYDIFLPGVGGWGGDRGPSTPKPDPLEATVSSNYLTSLNQAALYRLTGDKHPIHIDPEIAKANGFDRPIFHGLGTLGIAVREVAAQIGAHPADLQSLKVRLSAPLLPGQELEVRSMASVGEIAFEVVTDDVLVLSGGTATFQKA